MKFPAVTPIHTERLILRKFHMSDLDGHHRHITSDPEIAKTMLWEANPDIAHAENVLRKNIACYGSKNGYRWAIALKEDDSYIGTISLLRLEEEENSCSFAYMLGKAFWGQGYGTEAVKAVFQFAFEEMDIEVISADHFVDNPASGAVMRKAGMTQQGILHDKYEKNGILHDAVVYNITKEAWKNK